MDKINVYIVNHTHWDREWYRTYDEFRISLKTGVQRLVDQLNNKEIDNFFFDGQTIIIEDLKDVLSDKYYKEFIEYIKDGKIEVGPWYVLPDEGLIDNLGYEANLNIGEKMCEDLGVSSSKVMYLPDTFGHDISIPKLAEKYNIEYAIIHRGLNSFNIDVNWTYEDHKLKTLVLPTREGYYQTMFHKENYVEEIDKYINTYLESTNSNDVLILNGCDHTFVPDYFSQKIDTLKEQRPKYNIKQVTLSEFFKQAKYDYKNEISGELRGNSKAFLLPGVLSTRVYLKIQNRMLIDDLKYKYEKISKELNVYDNEQKNINYLWKEIVKNHPHDSICGCSIDDVHSEMEMRSRKITDNITTSLDEILNKKYYFDFKTKKFNDKLVIYNHTSKRQKLIDFQIDIPSESVLDNMNIYLESIDGKVYEVEVLDSKAEEVLYHDIKTEPDYQIVNTLRCSCKINLEPYKLNEFQIIITQENLQNIEFKRKINISEEYVEEIVNKYVNYKVITDKGDTYNFDPQGDYLTLNREIQSKNKGQNYLEVNVKSYIDLKTSYDWDKKQRCGETKVLEVFTKLIFDLEDKNVINIKVKLNNIHENIKLVNQVKIASNDIYSNTANGLIKREELENISYVALNKNEEVNYNQNPSLHDIYLKDKNICLSHIGLNEMEVLNDNVYITLLRAVGDLSRRDLASRNGGAGPSYETKEAQCIRELNFDILVSENYLEYDELNYLNIYSPVIHQYMERR